MFTRFIIALSIILPIKLLAQFTYTFDQSIPVEVDEQLLNMPWAGGLNSAVFNKMDLNADGLEDLVVFDRTSSKIQTFLASNNQYLYHPEYEALFPPEISRWILMRDYNCDGKKDLFTANNNGISVFENKTTDGNLTWEKLRFFAPPAPSAPPGTPGIFTEILLSLGFTKTNIFPGSNDIPSITDMDGDGDLDIVNIRFVNPFTAEFHKNMSMENYGTCDSLEYVRQTSQWGDFQECDCGSFAFNGNNCVSNGGRTNHSVGKSLLVLDVNGDGNKDLLFAEEDCPVLFYLQNEGTTQDADFNTAIPFPQFNTAIIPNFPSAYYEDIDFDNKPDLIVSPAVYARTGLNNPFLTTLWTYRNTGTEASPSFSFVQNNFLQEEMIEVGDYAYPAFFDYDADGDQDMFIGNYGNEQFIGVITQFENVGTPAAASFELVTRDFMNLSQLGQFSMKPQFIDINSDGNIDLAFGLSDPSRLFSNLLYIPGKSPNTLDFNNQEILSTGFYVYYTENMYLEDIDQDGVVDLLIGRSNGALEYWRNTAAPGSFQFVPMDQAFMGLGQSISRSNLTASIADLDNDSRPDLITGDQTGRITIFGDFRNTQSSPFPVTEIIFNSFTNSYNSQNLGGRIKPVAVNLFNSDKPSMAIGTVGGGMIILKNDGGQLLPDEPSIVIYPNPSPQYEAFYVRTDRNMLMQIFNIMGQKLMEPVYVGGNQPASISASSWSPGLYIARFTYAGKTYGRKFVIY